MSEKTEDKLSVLEQRVTVLEDVLQTQLGIVIPARAALQEASAALAPTPDTPHVAG